MIYRGQCHCGAIRLQLISDKPPSEQILGACQCSFCRKHNARAFSDPRAQVILTAPIESSFSSITFGPKNIEAGHLSSVWRLRRDDLGGRRSNLERRQY